MIPRRGPLSRLHGAAMNVQLPLILASVPVTVAVHAFVIVPVAAGPGIDIDGLLAAERPRFAALVTAVALVASALVATLAAALLLRGSIRTTVEELCLATESIASGDFRHRIAAGRQDELGRLAASIDRTAERLECLEHARRRTLACVSHELRTPLTIIQGTAFTLARHEHDVVRRERLELVQREAARLGDLVADLIDAASLHAGGVRIRPTDHDLGQLVLAEVDRFRSAAADRDVELEFALAAPGRAPRAMVDAARLCQALANLLSNAIRHAPPGSTVAVTVGAASRGAARITVDNACAPMPPEFIETVFEPFAQGETDTGSVGLGLTIVQAIVAAHGGRVAFDAELAARGHARIDLELPVGDAPRGRAARRPARALPRSVAAAPLALEH